MKRPVQLKNCQVILDLDHIAAVLERSDLNSAGNPTYNLEIILMYDGRKHSQTLTYETEEDRQHDMNVLVMGLQCED